MPELLQRRHNNDQRLVICNLRKQRKRNSQYPSSEEYEKIPFLLKNFGWLRELTIFVKNVTDVVSPAAHKQRLCCCWSRESYQRRTEGENL